MSFVYWLPEFYTSPLCLYLVFVVKVARGNAFLKLDDEPWRCVTYALKKFTGGMGDDDDRSNGGNRYVWRDYFTRVSHLFVCYIKNEDDREFDISCSSIGMPPVS